MPAPSSRCGGPWASSGWPTAVERYRPYFERYMPDVPTEVALAWIDKENCGYTGRTHFSVGGERGPSQVSLGEYKTMLPKGLFTVEDWEYLAVEESAPGWDIDRVAQIVAKHIHFIVSLTDTSRRNYALRWTRPVDIWSLVKLHHGAPAIVWHGMSAFYESNDRMPVSFTEFSNWVLRSGWHETSNDARFLANARAVGAYAREAAPRRVSVALTLTTILGISAALGGVVVLVATRAGGAIEAIRRRAG